MSHFIVSEFTSPTNGIKTTPKQSESITSSIASTSSPTTSLHTTLSVVTTNEDQGYSTTSTLQSANTSPDMTTAEKEELISTPTPTPTFTDRQTTLERQNVDSTTPIDTTLMSETTRRTVNESPTTTISSDMPTNGETTITPYSTTVYTVQSGSTYEQTSQPTVRSTVNMESSPSHPSTEGLTSTARQPPDTTEDPHASRSTSVLPSTQGKCLSVRSFYEKNRWLRATLQ